MTHSITRIDATYALPDSDELLSQLTIFAVSDVYRMQQVCRFMEYGWHVQEIQVDVSELSPRERAGLIGPIWPLLSFDHIVELLRDPPFSPDAVFVPAEGEFP